MCSTVLLLLALCVVYNVVFQFYRWFKFYFSLFWGTVMYDKECKTKGNEIYTKDNIEPQHKCEYTTVSCYQVSFKASDWLIDCTVTDDPWCFSLLFSCGDKKIFTMAHKSIIMFSTHWHLKNLSSADSCLIL